MSVAVVSCHRDYLFHGVKKEVSLNILNMMVYVTSNPLFVSIFITLLIFLLL